ncbi:3-dehydroquinate synthase II [Thermovibrio ammonificans]|jgi:3-dehydroquinate synthase II|uniref:3-dehydroquinate synthase homolog n=1 Tax=Thermovibrio ammonificans (strain DSM 15698 / JCM 12110 / HB-1) TaxID=648996 RepID=E8T2D9_THEA1|nr:3-dehydroquinate synthase II [Thermovibrio ammonificans]ADU97034.1 3-dehydroquinate synthase [Thermovibrio ammonificans HB-1]
MEKKELIVFIRNPENKKVVTAALESGVSALLLEKPESKKVKRLAKVKTIAPDGDYKLGEEFVIVEIKGKEDEERAAKLLKQGKKVIVKTTDWTIIPLENLLAQGDEVYAWVRNAEEAKTAITILEKGVKGVVLDTEEVNQIKEAGEAIALAGEKVELETAKIKRVKPIGMCDRVCIDTCSNMTRGEGALVGNSSAGMFLVHAETESNPYVAARPFRVNAGAVHMYVKVPGGKTKYLAEIESGDEVMIYNHKGEGRIAYVGRAKVEKRPMLLIEAETKDGKKVSAILQNAETIRLTRPDGTPISVVELKEGDEVLVYTEEPGRHFGMKVKESIVEK